jgi:signal transduction histidine kinase
MENLYKQFAESVTKWKLKLRRDEFFVTRIRLITLYIILSVIFLFAFSVVLYESLLGRLSESAQETILDPNIRAVIISKTAVIIQNLILLGDVAILIIVFVVGFFLTKKTLAPIKKAMEKQDRFIADASHELRTPLAVMKTSIEVFLRRKDLSAEHAREVLSDTLKEVNLLISLSNNLLSISKGHLSDIKFEKIYLPDILQIKIERLKHIAEEKNITLTLTGSAPEDKLIMGNDFMISQVFYNLIHNAMIYTPDFGAVKIDYTIRDNKYIVTISDTGIGISKENLTHIFEPFYRADNSRSTNGSGLGLSIVKSHISLHLGVIGVTSEIGKGTKFIVALPIFSS